MLNRFANCYLSNYSFFIFVFFFLDFISLLIPLCRFYIYIFTLTILLLHVPLDMLNCKTQILFGDICCVSSFC